MSKSQKEDNINNEENNKPKPGGDPLIDITKNMPEQTAVADTIAQKVKNEQEEQNPSNEETPQPKKRGPGRPRKDGKPPKPRKTKNKAGLRGIPTDDERNLAREKSERLATAAFVTDMVEISGVTIAGDDAKMGEPEKIGMTGAWERYFEAKGIADIPPGVALCLVCTQYYTRVLSSPPAQPKVKKFVSIIKDKVRKIKYARFMRWNDGKRQNDAGQETNQEVSNERDQHPST
jgi:hypothetical protein